MTMEVLSDLFNNSNPNVMSVDEYQDLYWGKLREAIDNMLTHPPGGYRRISYEQMYSAVYKCVCKQYSEKLYQDLINHVRTRVAEWSRLMQQVPDDLLIEKFHDALVQFFHAKDGIVPIFTYMSRFYIEKKLNTTLSTELLKIFSSMFSDLHVKRLIPLMVQAQSQPFSVHPQRMCSICKYLIKLNSEYSRLNPSLFQLYLPNIGPAMTEEDIERQKEEEMQLQAELKQQGWNCDTESSTRKREFDENP